MMEEARFVRWEIEELEEKRVLEIHLKLLGYGDHPGHRVNQGVPGKSHGNAPAEVPARMIPQPNM